MSLLNTPRSAAHHPWMVVEGNGDYDEETGETENLVLTGACEYRYDGARQRYLVMPRDPETLEPMNPESDGRWRDYAGDGIYLDYKADDIQGGTVNEVRQYLAGVAFNDRNESEMPVHFASDHLGSNRWLLGTDGSTPPLKRRAVYSAFGEERTESGTLGTRYGFAGAHGYESGGKGEDPLYNLGWLHLGHRYYDPASGRFMQRDPIGIRGRANVYIYADNCPTLLVDPLGLESTYGDPRSFVRYRKPIYVNEPYPPLPPIAHFGEPGCFPNRGCRLLPRPPTPPERASPPTPADINQDMNCALGKVYLLEGAPAMVEGALISDIITTIFVRPMQWCGIVPYSAYTPGDITRTVGTSVRQQLDGRP